MSTVVALRFPTGRYHATPWDRSVNEGVVEWPPSPWRILRALYATWRWRVPALDAAAVTEALSGLAAPPSFRLPRHSESHTRHYYPDTAGGTDKVFDPFACVDPNAELLVSWPTALTGGARTALARLCQLLPYLGRADSLCQARLLTDPEAQDLPAHGWCEPGDRGTLDEAAVRVLAPIQPLDLSALLSTSSRVRREGRTTPRGARWLSYQSPRPARPPAVAGLRRRARQAKSTAVRLAIAAAVLPTRYDAVTYGHVLRLAALSRRAVPSPALSGKRDGIRRDGHVHAHYLPLDVDDDRLLDTAVVWAPEGLDLDDVDALTRISRLTFGVFDAPGFRPVRLAVEACGVVAEVAPELVGPARVWRSWTPFAPYRHQAKADLLSFLAAELARELATRKLPSRAELRLLPGAWLDYQRLRPGEGRRGIGERRAFGLELRFPEPVAGPIALGALSHFGLGLFRPAAAVAASGGS